MGPVGVSRQKNYAKTGRKQWPLTGISTRACNIFRLNLNEWFKAKQLKECQDTLTTSYASLCGLTTLYASHEFGKRWIKIWFRPVLQQNMLAFHNRRWVNCPFLHNHGIPLSLLRMWILLISICILRLQILIYFNVLWIISIISWQ